MRHNNKHTMAFHVEQSLFHLHKIHKYWTGFGSVVPSRVNGLLESILYNQTAIILMVQIVMIKSKMESVCLMLEALHAYWKRETYLVIKQCKWTSVLLVANELASSFAAHFLCSFHHTELISILLPVMVSSRHSHPLP